MDIKHVWTTPNAEELVAYIARVSNPDNQDNKATAAKLIKYLITNKHWSPLDMVDTCIEITTTRDIARQILRHRSFFFQEFSQRYADTTLLPQSAIRECRMQDTKNRQNSLETADKELAGWWSGVQQRVVDDANFVYKQALERGVAKEVARTVLPEGLTMSKMYMKGTLRSWLHYIDVRTDMATQKEHRLVAEKCKEIIISNYPSISEIYANESKH